jgi:hypothetical protein
MQITLIGKNMANAIIGEAADPQPVKLRLELPLVPLQRNGLMSVTVSESEVICLKLVL